MAWDGGERNLRRRGRWGDALLLAEPEAGDCIAARARPAARDGARGRQQWKFRTVCLPIVGPRDRGLAARYMNRTLAA